MLLERPGSNLYIVQQLCDFAAGSLLFMLFKLLRSLLFLLPAELSHDLGLKGLRLLHACGLLRLLAPRIEAAPCQLLGLEFANPVGCFLFDWNTDDIRCGFTTVLDPSRTS